MFALLALALFVFAGGVAAPAHAAALPSAATSVFCSVAGNTFMHPTECAFGGFPGVPNSASAIAEPATPHVFATATTPSTGVLGAGASATLRYFFQVEGPTEGELVPVLMDAYLFTESTFESKGLARMIVSTTSGTFEGFEVCSDGTCEETTLLETINFNVLTGSALDSVTLYAEAQSFVTRSSNEVATAVADPFIYIDPAFPDAHLYRVVVSPGVGNAPLAPVPVPATLYLIGSGLCWTWWRGRRARSFGRVVFGVADGTRGSIVTGVKVRG